MEKCIFCDSDLDPGSDEHIFLSALGGRTITKRGTCPACNNAFATDETGKIDDSLALAFAEVRNGLKIWSGRDGPPPTLRDAGQLKDSSNFDLAPGFVPVVRVGRLPEILNGQAEYRVVARDEQDARRLLDIARRRGYSVELKSVTRHKTPAPVVHRSIGFDGPKVWRGIAKTAIVGFAVLYGNDAARSAVGANLRQATRYGAPEISEFTGWDFINAWPAITSLIAHPKSQASIHSEFEHSLLICDVGSHLVAYVSIFGHWRFSVRLGDAAGLGPRGLSLNPRSSKLTRFIVEFDAPADYAPRTPAAFKDEHQLITSHISDAFNRVLAQAQQEANQTYASELANDLVLAIAAVGNDEIRRREVINSFSKQLASIAWGESWESEIDLVLNEDAT